MNIRARTAVILALAGGMTAAHAQQTPSMQQTPSTQQIINALKPGSSLSATTRGIRPLPEGPDNAAPAAMVNQQSQPAAHQPAKRAAPRTVQAAPQAAPSFNLNVDFANGSAQLTPAAVHSLDHLGEALTSQTLAQYRFSIIGHTDTVGSPPANQTLSVARADAVKSYLESKFGIAGSRLDASGVGQSDLLVPTPPQTPNASNRRVQVINLGS